MKFIYKRLASGIARPIIPVVVWNLNIAARCGGVHGGNDKLDVGL
jgi:hypothetical protein